LIGDTTIYTHLDWAQELDKPMADQKDIPFRHLHRNVKYKPLNEFKVLSICGIRWNVLKVRKELIRRKSIQCNENQSINTKSEIIALKILKCIRDHILHILDSIYSIRSSQLLELMTDSTSVDPIVRTAVDQIEEIRRPINEEFSLNSMNE
jgi:hypothetical protein